MDGFHCVQFFNLYLQRSAVSDMKENGTFLYTSPNSSFRTCALQQNLITLQIFIFGNCFQAESMLTSQTGLSMSLNWFRNPKAISFSRCSFLSSRTTYFIFLEPPWFPEQGILSLSFTSTAMAIIKNIVILGIYFVLEMNF